MRNRTGKDGFCGSCPCAGGCHRPRGSCARRQRPAHALAPIGAVCQSMGNAPENSKASANGRKRNGGEVGREGKCAKPRRSRAICAAYKPPYCAALGGVRSWSLWRSPLWRKRFGSVRCGFSALVLPLRPFGTPAGPWTDAAFACISCGRASTLAGRTRTASAAWPV